MNPCKPFSIVITTSDTGAPSGKVADAEIQFHSGALAGLKLIGFGVWERRNGSGYNVTMPARQYSVNGERRSFALLRPVEDTSAQDTIRDAIVDAYRSHVDGPDRAPVSSTPEALARFEVPPPAVAQADPTPAPSMPPAAWTRPVDLTPLLDAARHGQALAGIEAPEAGAVTLATPAPVQVDEFQAPPIVQAPPPTPAVFLAPPTVQADRAPVVTLTPDQISAEAQTQRAIFGAAQADRPRPSMRRAQAPPRFAAGTAAAELFQLL